MTSALPPLEARLETRPKIRKVGGAFLESRVGDELVLLHLAAGTFNGLKDVGLAIWRLLDETGDPARIKAGLIDRYAIEPATCDREVDAFLDALIAAGLLVRD